MTVQLQWRRLQRLLTAGTAALLLAGSTAAGVSAASPSVSPTGAGAQPIVWQAVHTGPVAADKALLAASAKAAGRSAVQVASITAATTSCWSDSGYVYATSLAGIKIFQYNESHAWCGSGGYINYTDVYAWPSNVFAGYSFEGDTLHSTWGNGWNLWKEHLGAHFCLKLPTGCVANWYPWIEYEVGGAGQQYYYNVGW